MKHNPAGAPLSLSVSDNISKSGDGGRLLVGLCFHRLKAWYFTDSKLKIPQAESLKFHRLKAWKLVGNPTKSKSFKCLAEHLNKISTCSML